MASWDEVSRLALAMPEAEESSSYGNRAWKVAGRTFVWQRPFSKADLRRFDGDAPEGPILAARVDDLAEKEAVLAANPDTMFTIEHFTGYPAVLILLEQIDTSALEAAVVDAWLSQAPKALVRDYLARD
jgi:hypothetical protein